MTASNSEYTSLQSEKNNECIHACLGFFTTIGNSVEWLTLWVCMDNCWEVGFQGETEALFNAILFQKFMYLAPSVRDTYIMYTQNRE